MPVLRSREVVFTPFPPKTTRKRKSTPSVDDGATSPTVQPSTPLTKDVVSKKSSDSVSPCLPFEKGLGLGCEAGGRRRSLRLATMRSFDLNVAVVEDAGEDERERKLGRATTRSSDSNVVVVEDSDDNERERKLGRASMRSSDSNVVAIEDSDDDERERKLGRGLVSESNGIAYEVGALNPPDMVVDGLESEDGIDRRDDKGKGLLSVSFDASDMNKRTKFCAEEKGKCMLVCPAEPAEYNCCKGTVKEELLFEEKGKCVLAPITPSLKVYSRREDKREGVEIVGSDALWLDASMNKHTKFSVEEKGKRMLVCPAESARYNFGKGKGKDELLFEDEFIPPGLKVNILEEKSEPIIEVSNAVFPGKGHRVDAHLTLGRREREWESQEGAQRRMQDRQRALRAAPKFAIFRSQENPQGGDENITPNQQPARDPVDEDWPGPFSTARKIIDEREEKLAARLSKSEILQERIDWIPCKNRVYKRKAPTLLDLALRVLVKNASEIESLRAVPYVLRNQLTLSLSHSRKMDDHILGLLISDKPSEIFVPDCSWLTEEKFQKLFSNCDTEQLEVLELNLSGRCLPDYILRSTLACSPNSLPRLSTVSFCGDYRLSDDGLFALVSAAPLLHTINLSQCSLLTSAGINRLVETLAGVLRKLVIDECSSVEGMLILPSLKKAKNLEALSVCGVQSVTDAFVDGLVRMQGLNMKILGLASCEELSNASIKSIAEHCAQLHTLDLRNLDNIDDDAIMYLANGCTKIQNLKMQRNNISDEVFAVFLQKSGGTILELELNNIELVAHKTALAILSSCKSLQKLDLSFCREMSEEAIGLIVDSCSDLKVLKLFGCTQVTDVFLNGHRNSHVELIGLKGPIMKNLDVPNLM